MDQANNDLEPPTSSVQSNDQCKEPINLVRLPKVLLKRIDEETILRFQTPNSKNSKKRVAKVSKKVQKVSKKSPTNNANEKSIKRPRGRPKKQSNETFPSTIKKKNLKLEVKHKSVSSNKNSPLLNKNKVKVRVKSNTVTPNKKSPKADVKLLSKPGKLLKKTLLQKRSKVSIPLAKKPKVSPNKASKQKSPAAVKPVPPKPKLEIIQSKFGENSSDTSGDEFLYDELIEELENTANKRVQEKTTITLKLSDGNKPPTVLKGGIVKKTDLPSDLSSLAPTGNKNSNVMANGLEKPKHSAVLTPARKRKGSKILGSTEPIKKSSPWPVALLPSPKKSPATSLNSQKKTDFTTKAKVSQLGAKPSTAISPKNAYSSFASSEATPEASFQAKSISLGMPKAKIGPKQTAKVVPLSKSLDAEESDEYLEEETLECELEVLPSSKESKTDFKKSDLPLTKPPPDKTANVDLLKILTDDSEEPNKAKETPDEFKSDLPSSNKEETTVTQTSVETPLDVSSENAKVVENEEAPVRTIYDLMNEVFQDYPSWNLHLIPETSAFCIAQVTKGRLGLPTLKKCIELDPVSYNAKVYIHQYHIKRFDGVYDGEESILALIREIDSIKA